MIHILLKENFVYIHTYSIISGTYYAYVQCSANNTLNTIHWDDVCETNAIRYLPNYVNNRCSGQTNNNLTPASTEKPMIDQLTADINSLSIKNKSHQCDECSCSFTKKEGSTRHKLQIGGAKQITKDNNLICDACKKSYSSVSVLNRHKRNTKCKDPAFVLKLPE